ncbi:UNVERIFIED_CONTAM: hypothetical protein Slati_0396700 [Sesamum latifolium]|uniref:Uncharacterized protein n=1 Tax=Sesamum latifolium TaxID=2727402 RepID=A0AAW2XZZ4_9LAMI
MMEHYATTWPGPLPLQPTQLPVDPLAPDDKEDVKGAQGTVPVNRHNGSIKN